MSLLFKQPKNKKLAYFVSILFVIIYWLHQPSLKGGYIRIRWLYFKMGKLVIEIDRSWFSKVYNLNVPKDAIDIADLVPMLMWPILMLAIWLIM